MDIVSAPYRMDLFDGRHRLAYAIRDAYGWVVLGRAADSDRTVALTRVDERQGVSQIELRGLAWRALRGLATTT